MLTHIFKRVVHNNHIDVNGFTHNTTYLRWFDICAFNIFFRHYITSNYRQHYTYKQYKDKSPHAVFMIIGKKIRISKPSILGSVLSVQSNTKTTPKNYSGIIEIKHRIVDIYTNQRIATGKTKMAIVNVFNDGRVELLRKITDEFTKAL